MNVLLICKTPYNIMTALQIALTKHGGDNLDIVLFNTMSNVDKIAKNIEQCGLFGSVRICRMRKVDKPGKNILRRTLSKMCIFGVGVEERLFRSCEKSYDYIYDTPGGWVDKQIILKNKIRAEKEGKKTTEFLYEDGTSTYSKGEKSNEKAAADGEKKSIKIYPGFSGMYVFSPEIIEYKYPFPVFPIEKLSRDNKKYMDAVNAIFQYEKIEDVYDKKYIFFEESYFADGMDINDVDVIKDISEIVKPENIFVKIHPRNRENRFSKMGIKTNVNTEIPWEAIALNEKISQKILITVSSSSVLNILLVTKTIPEKIILLTNYEKVNKDALFPFHTWILKVAKRYSDIIEIPVTYEELKHSLFDNIK